MMRPSFNGRTSEFESEDHGSNPWGRATFYAHNLPDPNYDKAAYRPLAADDDLDLLFPQLGEPALVSELTDREREAFLAWWRE